MTLKTNSVETQREANYYGTEYALTRVGVPAFQKLKTPPKIAAIHYPDKNEFIPYDLERVDELPHLVWNQDLGKVWFLFDNRFEQPRVFMQFLIETPRVYDTVRHVKLAHLYNAVLKEQLNEMVYPIQLAGLSYSLSVEKKGVVLSIGGYNARLKDLLKLVAGNLTRINIQPQKFENLKEAMIRGLKNRKYAQAY
ncbi:MAG: peptidase M16, partial [Nitrospinaceae bacterium]|nr:peptidase M16 [Nitrospinaceae bacterium]NIR57033.1 peptidase M16 [Nitrospinaceae bacterium]NIS87486.1 peptidase M16 [Nitrospinaceae bacterium]NIT84340.1 peptidase M16 [Nitrospinaceae bacterium]NIU46529.1 peptidase M16 [Nitrospinaceae bacterium]